MGGELLDGAEVERLSSVGESGELKVLVHALAKSRAHERSFPNGVRKTVQKALWAYGAAMSGGESQDTGHEPDYGGPNKQGRGSTLPRMRLT
jgi:hypothetical protein